MVLAVGLRGYETETHGFVDKRYFAEVALLNGREPARAIRFRGKAPLGRWNASTRTALGFAHGLKWESTAKRKGAS